MMQISLRRRYVLLQQTDADKAQDDVAPIASCIGNIAVVPGSVWSSRVQAANVYQPDKCKESI